MLKVEGMEHLWRKHLFPYSWEKLLITLLFLNTYSILKDQPGFLFFIRVTVVMLPHSLHLLMGGLDNT